MEPTQPEIRERKLLTYVIASGDMRYIPVNEREIVIRVGPGGERVIRGEIPGCGEECFINLGQVLFEYSVSCEDCKDHSTSAEAQQRFSRHLGQEIAAVLDLEYLGLEAADRLKGALGLVLRSMDCSYSVNHQGETVIFTLKTCPITTLSSDPGNRLRLPVAHLGFAALCESLVKDLAPGWKLIEPAVEESEDPVEVVRMIKAS